MATNIPVYLKNLSGIKPILSAFNGNFSQPMTAEALARRRSLVEGKDVKTNAIKSNILYINNQAEKNKVGWHPSGHGGCINTKPYHAICCRESGDVDAQSGAFTKGGRKRLYWFNTYPDDEDSSSSSDSDSFSSSSSSSSDEDAPPKKYAKKQRVTKETTSWDLSRQQFVTFLKKHQRIPNKDAQEEKDLLKWYEISIVDHRSECLPADSEKKFMYVLGLVDMCYLLTK